MICNASAAKSYLERYTALDRVINRKLLERERIKSIAERCTAFISGMPSGGCSDMANVYIKLVGIDAEINDAIDAYVDMGREIEAVIQTVKDATLRDLLIYRYMLGWKWQRIADRLDRTVDMTRIKLHERALKALILPQDTICSGIP